MLRCTTMTPCETLGDLIQLVYGDDGAFIERQNIETFSLDNREFEHNYCVDVTDPSADFFLESSKSSPFLMKRSNPKSIFNRHGRFVSSWIAQR